MSTRTFKALSIVTNVKQGELVKRLIEENEELKEKNYILQELNVAMKMEEKVLRKEYVYVTDRFVPINFKTYCEECDECYSVWNGLVNGRINFDLCKHCELREWEEDEE